MVWRGGTDAPTISGRGLAFGLRVEDLGFEVIGFGGWGLRFGVWWLRFGVEGLGSRV